MHYEKQNRKKDAIMSTQKSIVNFICSRNNSRENVKSILLDMVARVVNLCQAAGPKKPHDGKKVTCKTFHAWREKFHWLKIVSTAGVRRLKCAVCSDAKVKNIWTAEGTTNVQISTITRHNSAADHLGAEQLLEKLKAQTESEADCLVSQECLDSSPSNIRPEDAVLFRTVYYAAYEELPTDKINSLLGLQRMNGLTVCYQNLSWTSISDIQDCIADILTRKLVNEIQDSTVFALMIDESTDVSIQKKLSVCVRYVSKGESKTQHLANVKLEQGNAHSIVNKLISKLQTLGIDVSRLVSFGTDGAATMMGRKTGVGVQMKAKYSPFMTQTHCMAHRLNLACNDSIKNIKCLQVFKEKFAALYHLISSSSVRTEKLLQMQEVYGDPTLSIKEPYSIRWLGLRNAVVAVYQCYISVLATLSTLAADKNPTAEGLYKYFTHYKVSLIVAFMVDVHNCLTALSCELQKKNLTFSEIQPLMDATVSKLASLATVDGEKLSAMKNSYKEEDGNIFFKGEKLSHFCAESKNQFDQLRKKYTQNLTENIRNRLQKQDSEVFRQLSLLLEPTTVNDAAPGLSLDALSALASLYGEPKTTTQVHGQPTDADQHTETKVVSPLLDPVKLRQEWPLLRGMIEGSYKQLNTSQLCKKIVMLHSDMIPNFSMLCRIALCMTVSSVECERSFSTQNRLKTKFRASLSPERLDVLMMMMCGPPVAQYNPDMAVRLWTVKKNRRRKRLIMPYMGRQVSGCHR